MAITDKDSNETNKAPVMKSAEHPTAGLDYNTSQERVARHSRSFGRYGSDFPSVSSGEPRGFPDTTSAQRAASNIGHMPHDFEKSIQGATHIPPSYVSRIGPSYNGFDYAGGLSGNFGFSSPLMKDRTNLPSDVQETMQRQEEFQNSINQVEFFFSNYIVGISEIHAKENGIAFTLEETRALTLLKYVLRSVREFVIACKQRQNQIGISNDPFFPKAVIPDLYVIDDEGFEIAHSLPLFQYIQHYQSQNFHGNFLMNPIPVDMAAAVMLGDLIVVAVDKLGNSAHYLLMPNPKELVKKICQLVAK